MTSSGLTSGRIGPEVTAFVLAGGRGLRLRSVISDRPKPLVDVGGRPFVTRLLDQLARTEIRRVMLCTGHMAEMVEESLGSHYAGLRLLYSREYDVLGTAGALRLALQGINSATALVLNGDSYCDVDLAAFGEDHEGSGAAASLVLVGVEDAGRYGRVGVDSEGWVDRFEEKVEGSGPGLINAGIYLLRRQVIETIPTRRAVSLEREIFPKLVGHGLRGYETAGRFLDVGTPASLARAEEFFTGVDS